MRPLQPQSGYTLIELLLYAAMLSMVLMVVVAFFGTTLEARVKNQSITEVNDQAMAVMDYLTRTIHNASSITTPAVGSSGQTLTLAMADTNLNPTIFSLTGTTPTTLQVKEGSGAQTPLTNDKVQLSNLSFNNLSRPSTPGIIQITFTLSRVNPASRNEFTYQKNFTTSAELAW